MTTFIALASSATMFPIETTKAILPSALTPELVKARLSHPELCVSALNNDHKATIDGINGRYNLELPLSVPGPDGRAPQIKVMPGDELFVVQASLPRLKAGERHSDATINAAPISFIRWRVPMAVRRRAPFGIPQLCFDRIIDCAYAIALWQRGETELKDADELREDFDAECKELNAATRRDDELLEWADVGYKALCIYHECVDDIAWRMAVGMASGNFIDLSTDIDAMLLKYGRRANGEIKDLPVERALIAPLLGGEV